MSRSLWKSLGDEYVKILTQEETYWFQQAKIKWINMGDQNTSFFNQSVLLRRRKHNTKALKSDQDN